jgi:hypothetical protein
VISDKPKIKALKEETSGCGLGFSRIKGYPGLSSVSLGVSVQHPGDFIYSLMFKQFFRIKKKPFLHSKPAKT